MALPAPAPPARGVRPGETCVPRPGLLGELERAGGPLVGSPPLRAAVRVAEGRRRAAGAEGVLRHRAALAGRAAVRLAGFPAAARTASPGTAASSPSSPRTRAISGLRWNRSRQLDALGLHVRADWPWVPMDGVRLPELLVTFGLQEMMFGARYLTAHSNRAHRALPVGGGFVPLWRGSYIGDSEWTFSGTPSARSPGSVDGESWYWCGQMRQGRAVGVPGRARAEPAARAAVARVRASTRPARPRRLRARGTAKRALDCAPSDARPDQGIDRPQPAPDRPASCWSGWCSRRSTSWST